jgi:hypothetical protein
MAARSGLGCDEAQFLWIVRIPSLSGMLDFLWHHESHPPLFYFLIRAWQGIFGDSEAAALALPMLFGSVLIPTTYWVGRHVFSPASGLIAAAFVTAAPLMVRYSAMVRPYSLLPLLCLLSAFSLWWGLKRGHFWPWAAHVAVTLAMLLTHNWAWMAFGAEWIIAAAWLALRRRQTDLSVCRSWAISQVAILVGYAPWFPALIFQSRHAGHDAFALYPLLVVISFAELAVSLPMYFALPVCAIFLLAGAWHVLCRRTSFHLDCGRQLGLIIFLGLPVLAFQMAAVLSIKKFLLLPHCLVTVAPCVLLVSGYAIASMSNMPSTLCAVITALYLIFSLGNLRDVKSNAREVAAVIAAQAAPKDLIVISPPWYASAFNYYYMLGNSQISYPHEERLGAIQYDDLKDRLLDPGSMLKVKEGLAEARREGRPVWLVIKPDLTQADAPDSDELPQSLDFETYGKVGRIRANQLRKHLEALYGVPRTVEVANDGRFGLENLQILLYTAKKHSLSGGNDFARSIDQ